MCASIIASLDCLSPRFNVSITCRVSIEIANNFPLRDTTIIKSLFFFEKIASKSFYATGSYSLLTIPVEAAFWMLLSDNNCYCLCTVVPSEEIPKNCNFPANKGSTTAIAVRKPIWSFSMNYVFDITRWSCNYSRKSMNRFEELRTHKCSRIQMISSHGSYSVLGVLEKGKVSMILCS